MHGTNCFPLEKKMRLLLVSGGAPATVRNHVRMQEFSAIQDITGSARRHGYGQPWMYEALALALEANGASESEIARVVLSAIDVSRDSDAALVTAGYLAALQFDRTALRAPRRCIAGSLSYWALSSRA